MLRSQEIHQLLERPHARGAFALRTVMRPPFSMRILAEAPITVLAPIKGRICILPDEGEPHWIGPGDVALTRGPDHYSVADCPESPTSVVIHPGQQCRSPEGHSMLEEMTHGVRTWGNDPKGPVLLLVGAYDSEEELGPKLCRSLPPLLSLKRDQWDSALTAMLCEEMKKDEPGQAALLDRMIDLLLVAVLKAWIAQPDTNRAELQGQRDPVVAQALKLLREDPARAWTVESLARAVNVSRAVLARRFHAVVGEPPMSFLTGWRMALAADWMCEPETTVAELSERLGYSSPFAFSTAFKRVRGVSPLEHRKQMCEAQAGQQVGCHS